MEMLWIATVTSCFVGFATCKGSKFTVYSQPVELRYGEVHNRMQGMETGGLALPEDVVSKYASGDVMMAISGFDVDMLRIDADGVETPVKLSDHYLHHYILDFGQRESMKKMLEVVQNDTHAAHMITGCHGMKGAGVRMFRDLMKQRDPKYSYVSFGSAAGAEYRHNPQRLEAPFRLMLKKPEVWLPTLHIINTNLKDNRTSYDGDGSYVSRLLECPCTPQRKIDVKAGTIDGKKPDPPIGCSKEFAATGNPSCHLSTYQGGWRCCEHGMFLVDTDKECKTPDCSEKVVDRVQMKYTFYYEDATPSTRPVEASACCDVTSDEQFNMNIEYDIPVCATGSSPESCIHVAESVQPIGEFSWRPSDYHGKDLVDLVFAAPHLHWAGNSIELIDHETNKTLCKVSRGNGVKYGSGETAGDENGYLVGLTPCTWGGGDALRFRRDHLLRTRAVYNATSSHTGVMSLWLMQVSPVSNSALVV